jgi:hypothetical protein
LDEGQYDEMPAVTVDLVGRTVAVILIDYNLFSVQTANARGGTPLTSIVTSIGENENGEEGKARKAT